MRRKSETLDPAGTAMGVIGAAAVGYTAAVMCPPLMIFAPIAGLLVKIFSKREVEERIDNASLRNCDRLAEEWHRQFGRGSVSIGVTETSDALIPLPRRRIHHYVFDEEPVNFRSVHLNTLVPLSSLSDDKSIFHFNSEAEEIPLRLYQKKDEDFPPTLLFTQAP